MKAKRKTKKLSWKTKPKITFSKSAIPFILEALKKSINKSGFVVDVKTNKYVLDADGKKFKSDKLIGFAKKKFITNIFQFGDIVRLDKNGKKK